MARIKYNPLEDESFKKQRGGIDLLRQRLDAMQAPKPMQMESNDFQDQELPQFKLARERAEQQSRSAEQQGTEALERRLAATGALNSGAGIKLMQQAQDQYSSQRQSAINDINTQEAAARIQRKDAFGEAVKQRNLSREMANADREFQDKVFRFDSGSKLAQLDLAIDQNMLAKDESEFNKRMENFKAGRSGGLFGGGGFLGLGIGAQDEDI